MSVLDSLSDKINNFQKTWNTLVTKRVGEVERSLEFLNTKYETNREENKSIELAITENKKDNDKMINSIDRLGKDLHDLQERHIDLQTSFMRENLVVTWIPQTNPNEETEEILKNFMRNNLKFVISIDFHRAHGFGKPSYNYRDSLTRPIVCRFKCL